MQSDCRNHPATRHWATSRSSCQAETPPLLRKFVAPCLENTRHLAAVPTVWVGLRKRHDPYKSRGGVIRRGLCADLLEEPASKMNNALASVSSIMSGPTKIASSLAKRTAAFLRQCRAASAASEKRSRHLAAAADGEHGASLALGCPSATFAGQRVPSIIRRFVWLTARIASRSYGLISVTRDGRPPGIKVLLRSLSETSERLMRRRS
jgi:hypothetical protein